MKTNIIGKQLTVYNDTKVMIEKKLAKLDRYFKVEPDATVTLSRKRNVSTLEITINAQGTLFRSEIQADSFRIMSNNMAKDSTHAYCDVRGKKAIAFAGQINDVEALRAEKKFKDIVRGLDTFGAKVIDEARIQVVKIPVKASA